MSDTYKTDYNALVIHRCEDGHKLNDRVSYAELTAEEQSLIRECSDDLIRYAGYIVGPKLHWTRTEFPWPPR